MTQDSIIEPISTDNFDDFIYLIDQLAAYEKLTPPDLEAKARLRRDGLGDECKYHAYIARVNDKPVAYLIFMYTYSSFLAKPTFYIEDIFVLEEYRRKGIGEELFRFCSKLALDHGCGRIEFCVLTWNEPAIQFYEKNNAKRLDWYFYRMDEDQLKEMQKPGLNI
jgi:GNAT superfamily N-acetyltransferase